MNAIAQLLRVIQVFKVVLNPVFFIPLHLNKNGFSASRKRTVLVFIPLIVLIAFKVYFFTLYKLEEVELYIQSYSVSLILCLCATSYLGYAVNGGSIAKLFNNILFISRPLVDKAFCRRLRVFAVGELSFTFLLPLYIYLWSNSNPFFYDYEHFWLFTADLWISYFLLIHLTVTALLFSDTILLCRLIIAKVNRELVKFDRIEWFGSVEAYLKNDEKLGGTNRVVSSEGKLDLVISLYDSACQSCSDLNGLLGCSVFCSYICNLVDMVLVLFYLTKYGVGTLGVSAFTFVYNFVQNWFVLYACETFTKEMQKTGVIVNRLILETKSQRQRELLQQFSNFLLHRKIKFTAWGLFTLDYKMIYSTMATIITYLALVHQFDSQYKTSDVEGPSHNLSTLPTTSTTVH